MLFFLFNEDKFEYPMVELPSNYQHAFASDYDEIDQIYDYIRGVRCLPQNMNLKHDCKHDDAIRCNEKSRNVLKEKKENMSENLNPEEFHNDFFEDRRFRFRIGNPCPRHRHIDYPLFFNPMTTSPPMKFKANMFSRMSPNVRRRTIASTTKPQRMSFSFKDYNQSPIFNIS